MKQSSLRHNILQLLKDDQVAIAKVAVDLGCTYRTVERYLESATNEHDEKAYNAAHQKLTTPAALTAIRTALHLEQDWQLTDEVASPVTKLS